MGVKEFSLQLPLLNMFIINYQYYYALKKFITMSIPRKVAF